MRLISKLFVFVSALFIVLYGVLSGFFKIEGTFIASYVAGKNLLEGINPVLLYRFPLFQKLIGASGLSEKIMYLVGATPTSIAADAFFAFPPVMMARILFTAANIVALVMLVHATAKVAETSNKTTYLVFLSTSFALAYNFQASEPFIILTLLFVLAFYAFSLGKLAACGVFIGLAFPFNPVLGLPVLLFLLATRWRTFTYFLMTTVVVLVITYLVVGNSTFVFYYQRIVTAYLNGRVLNPFSDTFQTAWSFLRRVFIYNETLNPTPLLNSTPSFLLASSFFKAAIVVPTAYFFYKGVSMNKPREALVAATFPTLFFLPTFTPAELVLLAPAIVAIVQAATEEGRTKLAGTFLVLYALACIPFYTFEGEYGSVLSIILNYESFLLLVAIYIVYLIFQSRIVPKHLRYFRLVLTFVIVCAATATLYIGERFVDRPANLPLTPVLPASVLNEPAFSPGLHSGRLTYVALDSATETFKPEGADPGQAPSASIYSYGSGDIGDNYAMETTRNGEAVVYFRTHSAAAFYSGYEPRISADEDYGAYLRQGKIFLLDLDPRYIARLDSISVLPYKIVACSFNADKNNEIDFIVDSLNDSYAIAAYNLFNRNVSTYAVPFRPYCFCAVGDTVYATQDVADSTAFWRLVENKSTQSLFVIHASIYDVTSINNEIYLSSDYRRGIENPTVYKYLRDSGTPSR